LLTYMFMHGNWGHIIGNMLGLYVFGTKLEMVWGPKRFLTFYLLCGIGAGLISGLATLAETYPMISDLNFLAEHPTARNFTMLLNKYDKIRASFSPEILTMVNDRVNDPRLAKEIFEVAGQLKGEVTRGQMVGASGSIYGLLAGIAYLFPNDEVYIYGMLPIKMKWLAAIYGAISVYGAIQSNPQDPVAHIAHLGGALVGFLIVYFSYRRGNRRKLF